MRQRRILSVLAVLLTVALVGCTKKTEQFTETTSDSLVAANPLETPAADLTPQTDYQEPAPAEPAAPRPRPRREQPRPTPAPDRTPDRPVTSGTLVPSGTPIAVTVNTDITSENAQPGDTWSGVVANAVIVDGVTVIPAGSTVSGVVTASKPAQKGDRAMLDLAVRSVNVGGNDYSVDGGTEEIIAGSTRARNLGAIAGGAAAGALIGRAVGGSGKGGLVGGIIGGATAAGAVAASKGYQVHIKPGTEITFTTTESVRVRT